MDEKQYYQLSEKQKRYGKLKLIIDTVMAIGGTVILSPLFLGIVIASLLSMKGQKNKNNFKKHLQGVIFLHFFEALCPYYGYREVPQHS